MQRRAVLVGVDKYEEPGYALEGGAGNDVDAMCASLRGWGFDTVRVIKDEAADRDTILDVLAESAHATSEGDLLFLYFACRGYTEVLVQESHRHAHDAILPYDMTWDRPILDTTIARCLRIPEGAFLVAIFDCGFDSRYLKPPASWQMPSGASPDDYLQAVARNTKGPRSGDRSDFEHTMVSELAGTVIALENGPCLATERGGLLSNCLRQFLENGDPSKLDWSGFVDTARKELRLLMGADYELAADAMIMATLDKECPELTPGGGDGEVFLYAVEAEEEPAGEPDEDDDQDDDDHEPDHSVIHLDGEAKEDDDGPDGQSGDSDGAGDGGGAGDEDPAGDLGDGAGEGDGGDPAEEEEEASEEGLGEAESGSDVEPGEAAPGEGGEASDAESGVEEPPRCEQRNRKSKQCKLPAHESGNHQYK